MSHFCILVTANDEAELEHKLLPYHEYECTGIEEYIEWVPEDMAELKEKHAEYGGDTPFEEWIPDWCGAEQNDDGVWGRYTNPNAKWDWYSIGGRWDGYLITKYDGPRSYAHAAAIDWEAMREQLREARKDWEDERAHDREILTLFWGFIDHDGAWVEKARMGWWGSHDEVEADYARKEREFIDSLDPDTTVYVIDCHI